MENDLIGELCRKGILSEEEVEEVVSLAESRGMDIRSAILHAGKATEEEVLEAEAGMLGIPFKKSLESEKPVPSFIERFPMEAAMRLSLIAVYSGNGMVYVATSEPSNPYAIDEIALALGEEALPMAVPREAIRRYISNAYEMDLSSVDTVIGHVSEKDLEGLTKEVARSEDLADMANKAPIIKLINTLLFQALRRRASDVHIQPFEGHVQVRFRIDGILYDVMRIPKGIQEAIVSRIKVMGRMDIAEKRLPQDGQTSFVAGGREVDVRISTIPSVYGERVVMRLQDKSTGIYDIRKIGLLEDDFAKINRLIRMAHGIILVTGPTGSGKTTTLYAALKEINTPEKNIITVEDPVEYQLPGITQVQVSAKKGMTFATGLRSIVRQDPDIIMVGEIRDLETVSIAIQSALTGHLVFSTLHTNDAPGAVSRLLDLGAEPYLVNSSLIAVIAQRLVRKVCASCREEYKPSDKEMERVGLDPGEFRDVTFFKASGCEECQGMGYMGRMGIFEILEIDDHVKSQISRRASSNVIKKKAIERGKLRTLRQDGIEKAKLGLTTLEEVERVTQMDIG